MGKDSEEEAELVRKNQILREQMTEQLNQNMVTTMADLLKASMKEFREEMRQEMRQAIGQGHGNESRRNRRTPTRQEHLQLLHTQTLCSGCCRQNQSSH